MKTLCLKIFWFFFQAKLKDFLAPLAPPLDYLKNEFAKKESKGKNQLL